jgi:hypothetical protein
MKESHPPKFCPVCQSSEICPRNWRRSETVRELYQRVRDSSEGFRLDNLLTEMRIDLRVNATDLALIPRLGQWSWSPIILSAYSMELFLRCCSLGCDPM